MGDRTSIEWTQSSDGTPGATQVAESLRMTINGVSIDRVSGAALAAAMRALKPEEIVG